MNFYNRRLLLERVEKFLSPLYWADINIQSHILINQFRIKNIRLYEPEGHTRPNIVDVLKLLDEFKSIDMDLEQSFYPSWSTKWFHIEVELPESANGAMVGIIWDSNSEAMLYDLHGNHLQAFTGGGGDDRRDAYIASNSAVGTSKFEYFIEMACNGMFGNGGGGMIMPPDPNKIFKLEKADIVIINEPVQQLYWDIKVIYDLAQALPEESPIACKAISVLTAILNITDLTCNESIKNAREIASTILHQKEECNQTKIFHEITALGHCHIDTAWLWPYAETRRKVARSWSTQALLLEKYPTWKFVASQSVQWEWLQEDHPKLFNRLKTLIESKRLLPVGSTYVEFDANIPSGESMVRQFLYGNLYFKEQLGVTSKVFWLPDTFGYSGQLPQIMKGFGINYFVSQKLSWNLFNK